MWPRLPASLIAVISLAAVVVALPSTPNLVRADGPPRRTCGSEPSPEAIKEKERAYEDRRGSGKVALPAANYTIPVYFHVVYATTNISDGYIPDSQIQNQMNVLAKDYASTGISFQLKNITRTLNQDWFDNASPETDQQTAMKTALRQGDVGTLNVYSVGFTSDRGLLGYATFPADYSGNPTDDGVVVLYSTLPGGTSEDFNLGRTLTHEGGHWLGLYHPFQDGCDGDGDFVDDTPAEAIPGYGCPIGRDTCPSPGLDPVQNYMDYSNDACMNNFTPGQAARIKAQITTFRGYV